MLINIKQNELQFIRQKIHERINGQNGYEYSLKINAYLPNYEELKRAIMSSVPDFALSVSTGRLRKLFYYTDPTVCQPDQLLSPRFAEDFLNACYLYISGGVHDRASFLRKYSLPISSLDSPKSISKMYWLIAVILGGIIILFLFRRSFFHPSRSFGPYFEEHFDQVDWDSLQGKGWEIWNSTSDFPLSQDNPGFFCLPTLPAMQKENQDHNLLVQNLLVRQIDCECCIVEVWMEFSPKKNWQQAGILLIKENEYPVEYKSISVHFSDFYVKSNLNLSDSTFFFVNNINEDYMSVSEWTPMHSIGPSAYQKFQDRLFIRLVIRNNQIKVVGFKNEKHAVGLQDIPYPFQPKYLGLFAMQGQTTNNTVKADSTPANAYFDYVKVLPCE